MFKKNQLPITILIAGIIIAGAVLVSREAAFFSSESDHVSLSPVTEEDHMLGNPEAQLIFIEYSDTECPFCKQFQLEKNRIMSFYGERGEVAWVYRHLPTLNDGSVREALALECAGAQGESYQFWNFLESIYENKPAPQRHDEKHGLPDELLYTLAEQEGLDGTSILDCIEEGRFTERVESQVREANASGATRTPFTVILLPEPLSEEREERVRNAVVDLPADSVTIPLDKEKILLNGMISAQYLEQIAEAILTPAS